MKRRCLGCAMEYETGEEYCPRDVGNGKTCECLTIEIAPAAMIQEAAQPEIKEDGTWQ